MLKQFDNGNILLEFIDCDDPQVPDGDDTPLTWAMVVVQKDDKFLLHHNYNRMQWECGGGGIEPGETVKQAAIREVLEETSQHVLDIHCRGIFKLYLRHTDRSEFGALYIGTIDQLQQFQHNNESDRITLWHPDDPLDDRLSELSHWMIAYVMGS